MNITFIADEIFEMAEEIERNGAKFYRAAAANSKDESIRQMLLEMAAMEDEHLATFENMRKELTEAEKEVTTYDPDNEVALYLQTMADARGYEGRVSPTIELTGKESPRQILEIALNSEKESVVFYYGLKGLATAKTGEKKIEGIIIEELSHITAILNRLKELDN